MADIQSPTAEISEEKKKEEERRNHRMKIYSVMVCPIPQGGHKNHRIKI